MYNQIRGNEIEWWLKHVITKNMTLNSEVRKHFKENVNISDKPEYVIIDNDSDMLETQMEHFIKLGSRKPRNLQFRGGIEPQFLL
jgi:hypothetical protein